MTKAIPVIFLQPFFHRQEFLLFPSYEYAVEDEFSEFTGGGGVRTTSSVNQNDGGREVLLSGCSSAPE